MKFPPANLNNTSKQNTMSQPIHTSNNLNQMNGHILETPNHNGANGQYSTVQPMQTNDMLMNGHTLNSIPMKSHAAIPSNNYTIINNHTEHNGMYCANPPINPIQNTMHHNINGSIHRSPFEINQMYGCNAMPPMNHFGSNHGYYCNPMPSHPYVMQAPHTTYGPVRQASTLPLVNGYHCAPMAQPAYCSNVPTGQLIELEAPGYTNNRMHNCCPNLQMSSPKHVYHTVDRVKSDSVQNSKDYHFKHYDSDFVKNNINYVSKKLSDMDCEIHDSIRRNSAPRSSMSNASDHFQTLPRSDTQPSLSKAREDGMGTFESWDYVFRNLESQGYSKDLGDRGNVLSPPLDRDSKTLGRLSGRDSKKYQPTTMDLEDALRAMSLEKSSDEEVFRTAKINETLQKIKQESDAKAAKTNYKKQTVNEERERRKIISHDITSVSPVRDVKITDKTRLIPKEESREKKEMDKEIYVNGNAKIPDSRKSKKSVVKCLSSEAEKNSKKKTVEQSTLPINPKRTNPSQGELNIFEYILNEMIMYCTSIRAVTRHFDT